MGRCLNLMVRCSGFRICEGEVRSAIALRDCEGEERSAIALRDCVGEERSAAHCGIEREVRSAIALRDCEERSAVPLHCVSISVCFRALN